MATSPISFDDNIIALLGLEGLPEEARLAMLNQMSDLVQKRVILRLMESLPEEAAAEAEKLAEKPEELLVFLSSRVDLGKMISEETELLKNELLVELNEAKLADAGQ